MKETDHFFQYIWWLFPLWWALICFILAHFGGWSELSEIYRTDNPFDGSMRIMQSGSVGTVGYRSCLNIGANKDGLYLSVLLPFRIGHPALFIPWTDISAEEQKLLWIGRSVKLSFSRAPGTSLTINRRLAEHLKKGSNGSWQWEPSAS